MLSQGPRVLVICIASVASVACDGGGGRPKGSDNTVAASVSPTGTVSVYLNKSQSISIAFGTSDGRSASALSVSSGLASLPVGWVGPAGGFECPVVGSGATCTLALQYLPTTPAAGTFALGFSYRANNGAAKQGSVAIDYSGLSPTLELLAGSIGGQGNLDGAAAAARFYNPWGVAVGSDGTVYVADSANNTIRKITAEGVVTTLAGSPNVSVPIAPYACAFTDGIGAAAAFCGPEGIAVDRTGTVYAADSGNNTIRKITPAGVVTTFAGTASAPGFADGTGAAARFTAPDGIAVDAAGTVYVTDSYDAIVRKITPGGAVTTLAGTPRTWGAADGAGAAAQFDGPAGVAVDSAGTIYLADGGNNTIRKITREGFVTTLAGLARMRGSDDGIAAAARFNYPEGVAVDNDGAVSVADSYNCTIRRLTQAGAVTTLAGAASFCGSQDGAVTAARFNHPIGLAFDTAGNLYVSDFFNHAIRKITPAGIVTTVLGDSTSAGVRLGSFPASLGFPRSLAVRPDGQLVIADGSAILVTRGL